MTPPAPPNSTQVFQKSLPLDESWDVVVLGGGPTGCTAATAAAREGARTLLLESTGVLGGSGTSSLVPAWCPFSDGEKVIYRGLAEQILNRCKADQPLVPEKQVDWVPIDPELLKRVYDALVTDAGVTVCFHTFLSAVERNDEGDVTSIVVTNKLGLSAIRAKVYIDCTGDADLCAWAGADFLQGDEKGSVMPATHCFVLSNVNEAAFRSVYNGGGVLWGGNPTSPLFDILASGKYPLIPDAHLCCNLIGPSTVGFNAGHLWDVDNTDPESVSRALIKGRKIAAEYRKALAEACPDAFGDAFLVTTGSTMGIRETRRIIGDYVLTFDDYMARRAFEDEICRNSYFIDVHWAKEQAARKTDAMDKWENTTFRYKKGESHGIPYRCLTPAGLRNVLVAGRSISCERIVQGSVRVMPVCLAMGEAAGIAAAFALRTPDFDVHRVDTDELRDRLRGYGAYLPVLVEEAPAVA
jgi:glycine/D-amino acid oxidase-like deaminating enzyme